MRGAEQVLGRLADDAADGVAAAAGIEGGDRREVELADAARAGDGRGVDLVHGERAVQLGGGAVEALVLVLGALDRLEDPLRLNDSHHLLGRAGHERDGCVVELVLPGPIADQDPARRAPLDHRHADERADGRRPAVVGEQRQAGRLQHEGVHLFQDRAQHAAARPRCPPPAMWGESVASSFTFSRSPDSSSHKRAQVCSCSAERRSARL